ncbi:hypothetical protein DZC30_00860 [Comamonas testosteroni]|uniref:Uncharacterized protein n=1 Tax=Comamonas testosteroni TaxID=285 RepID=A0A373FUA7_COMTE|nr:hypothetical protein [Comamonas testosteroni]RGE46989.1 hypothetical protein DZC30_00860 [Comamonas testosteroni]
MSDMHCPDCGSSFSLERVVAAQAEHQALDYLLSLAVPVADAVAQYLQLHTPAKQRLTLRKKLALVAQLQPDLSRQCITHKGRDWQAPHANWQAAIAQMLRQANDGTLTTPLSGHTYLYTVLAGMARTVDGEAPGRRDTVVVRGQPMSIGEGLQVAYGGKDPALAAVEERNRQASPMPDHIREQIAALRGKKGNQ